MAKRGPESSTKRLCLVCGGSLARRESESKSKWNSRQTCSDECKRVRISQQSLGGRGPQTDKYDPTKMLQPWPEGIRFDSLTFRLNVTRITRPETHRPYGTSASWAVGGGGDL